MSRYHFVLVFVLLLSFQSLCQTAGCDYPENGPYECKMGDVVLETGHFKDGMKNGVFNRYTFGGKLLVSEKYVDDKRDGEAKTFHENGQVKFLRKYENGIRLSDESFWEDGTHKYKQTMDAKGRQGVHYAYYKNGNLKEEKEWKDDVLQGSTNYDEEGRKTVSYEMKDGTTSYMRKYYTNGQVSEEGPLGDHGYQEGHWKIFDEAGTLRMEGNYEKGKRKGEWKAYDEKGELAQTKIFE